MARQEIFLGLVANDRTGNKLRVGGAKINENFIELYDLYAELLGLIGGGATGTITTVAAASSSPTNSSPILFTITFNQAVTGFTIGDISVTNGTAGSFNSLSGSEYTVEITPSGQGVVGVSIPANVAGGAGGQNLASNLMSITYDSVAPAVSPPFVILTEQTGTTVFQLTFTEPVTGVNASDFTFVNGGGVTGSIDSVVPISQAIYNVTAIHSGSSGTVQVALSSSGHGIEDLAGNAFAPAGITFSDQRTIVGATTNNQRYYGHSVDNVSTSDQVKALAASGSGAGMDSPIPSGSGTDNDISFTIAARGTLSFGYYSFPARYGPAPNLVFNSFPSNSDWVELPQVLVTPTGGVEEAYRVYRTQSPFDSEGIFQIS